MFDWVLNAPRIQEILLQRCYHHQPDSTHMSKISHSLSIPKRRCSIKKTDLKNLAIFTGKHLCCSLFLTEWQALTSSDVFIVNFEHMLHICFPAVKISRREKCPNTEFFYSVRMRETTDQKKLCIWTLFT